MERLPFVVQSKPATESRRLTLLFPVPDTDAFIDRDPLRYIGHLLGHESEGSLLAHLKSKGYANGLSAGESLGMTESRSFSISISLTPEGFADRDEIISEIFRTIRLIEIQGIDRWRFDELKMVSDANFKFERSQFHRMVTICRKNCIRSLLNSYSPMAAYLSDSMTN